MEFVRRLLVAASVITVAVSSVAVAPLTAVQAQGDVVLLAVGDIASCTSTSDEKVAALMAQNEGLIALTGDNIQSDGQESSYMECFDPAWAPLKDRLRPTPGNHDYLKGGTPAFYYTYFAPYTGEVGKGWYSYNYGAWHVIVMNSMEPDWAGTEQNAWLKADLAANPAKCTLAYWHNPIFHSGAGPITRRMRTSFQLLYEAGAEFILSGDAHHYERFKPMSLNTHIEPDRGIRQFIVGTGGASHTRLGAIWKGTEVRDNTSFGILKLVLSPDSYAWQFIPIDADGFTDSGSTACH